MPFERIAYRGTGLGIPDSNRAIVRSGDDIARIGRVSNGRHSVTVSPEKIAYCGTSFGIPYSNGIIVGPGDDVAPIG